MLRRISSHQLFEWETYSALEPFGETRDDYRNALVVKALWDIARDIKIHPEQFQVEKFLLAFKDPEDPAEHAKQQEKEQTERELKWQTEKSSLLNFFGYFGERDPEHLTETFGQFEVR